jgi:ATP-dependent Clp protease ATP-binding subunit ClpC
MVRKDIEEHSPVRERISISIDLPISDECQRILLQASEEAECMGHKHIGTEHRH